jgi:adenylate cyclase
MEAGSKRIERKLAAIFAADVAGYSRLMESDEVGTMRSLMTHRELIDHLIAEHGGRIANTAGDSILAEFPSAVDAVQCAVEIQRRLEVDLSHPKLQFRIGVHVGDVIVRGGDLLGDGVNIAARLQALAEPGGICISGAAHDYVRKILPLAFADLGLQQVKNIAEPVRVYAFKANSLAPATGTPKPLPLPDKPSIAVLPFANMGGDPEQEYFADGVVEDIITALSRVRWFFVIARNSSFAYKGKVIDIRQIGRELGVRYVLEGSIRKAGSRVRITGQVVEAENGRHIWADKFDGDLADIFELQDRITESVVGAIEPSLRLAEISRSQAKPTENLDAYDLYLRALPSIYAFNEASFRQAETFLKEAVQQDPNYSDALAALADCVGRMTLNGWINDTQQGYALACDYARRAIAADPENGLSLATGAWAFSIFEGNFDQALDLADRALRIFPNSAQVRSRTAWAFIYSGDSQRGIEQLHEAQRLSPVDPSSFFTRISLAIAHFFQREFDLTVRFARQVLAEVPTHNVARRYLAAALAHLDQVDEAQKIIAELLKAQPSSSLLRARTNKFRHHWMMDLYVSGLAKAGLPEQ